MLSNLKPILVKSQNEIILITGSEGYIANNLIKNGIIVDIGAEEHKPSLVIHLAARPENSLAAYLSNIEADTAVLHYCEINNLPLLYISGNNVYPLELNCSEATNWSYNNDLYPLSKIHTESLLIKKMPRVKFIILRVADVFGANQRHGNFFRAMAKSIRERRPLTLYGDGSKIRSYIYIKELVSIMEYFSTRFAMNQNEVFNVCYNESPSIKDIVELLSQLTGLPVERKDYPNNKSDVRTMTNDKLRQSGYEFHSNFMTALQDFIKELTNND